MQTVCRSKNFVSNAWLELGPPASPTPALARWPSWPGNVLRVRPGILPLRNAGSALTERRRIVDRLERLQIVRQLAERIRNRREDSRQSPHQYKQKRPDSEGAVEVPVES